jgi:acetoin:2,6-dichlorophenolindophenol oxidoreductase subunit beta
MRMMTFANAIEDALCEAMAKDERIVIFGEDVHGLRMNLYVRFGERRVRPAPISESGFLGAAVGAAMAGLKPVVEIMLVDFLGVSMSALINEAAKIEAFSGGKWKVPMVVRSSCGGGYGDGGQHEQALWGWLAHIPGLSVVVPSTPADAGALMLSALQNEGPVVFLEHKLLSDYWLEYMGSGGRSTVSFDIPVEGAQGQVPDNWDALPLGKAISRLDGNDIILVSVAVGVHRCIEASRVLKDMGISAGVIDLRSIAPLDRETLCTAVSKTGRIIIVDEDYRVFGLSGELAAILLESGVSFKYRRVCTEQTIPYSRQREDEVLPNVKRIVDAAGELLDKD